MAKIPIYHWHKKQLSDYSRILGTRKTWKVLQLNTWIFRLVTTTSIVQFTLQVEVQVEVHGCHKKGKFKYLLVEELCLISDYN